VDNNTAFVLLMLLYLLWHVADLVWGRDK
jgi:hypothetical protein